MSVTTEYAPDYLEARGISGPQGLADALRRVLDNVEPIAHELPASGLSEHEQAVLVEGGLRLERTARRDLVAEGAVRFAALVERSFTADEVATRLQVTPGRVHQLMSRGELYSFRLDGKRLIPRFQLVETPQREESKLVANIMQVNKRLPSTVHPLGVFAWYHTRSADLIVDDDDPDSARTPLEWLAEGRDPDPVAFLAEHL